MITIEEFRSSYQAEVVNHILDIENNEFNMDLTLELQSDLKDIYSSYQKQNGNFWIALDNNSIVGTIGIYSLAESTGELRRMFVKPQYRGKEFKIGQKLLDILLEWSKTNGYKQILLETTSWLIAANKFYAKNNFKEISIVDLPENFPVLRVSGKFMSLTMQ